MTNPELLHVCNESEMCHLCTDDVFLDVSWTIPFTAVATSVAAIITQFFLGHRYVLLRWPLGFPDQYYF